MGSGTSKNSVASNAGLDDDGWGPDAPPVTRTQLEKVQPAYKPTKVNMQELRSGKPTTTDANVAHTAEDNGGVVKGGYQPVGKVDIAAIRRQARESGELKDDRPEPVKGAHEPVGKVDIAAIRARAQPPSDTTTSAGVNASDSVKESESATASQASTGPSFSGRLTSLPKPKISNKVAPAPTFAGTKPPLPNDPVLKPAPAAAAQVGSASRTFADEGGKTPAQIWAERKAKAQGASGAPTNTEHSAPSQQSDNAEWKSSYSGRTWAPVQTTHTGKSAASNVTEQATGPATVEEPETGSEMPRQSVSAIRDQIAHETSKTEERPADTSRTVPIPDLPADPTEAEVNYEPESHQDIPSPPRQPRSPSPPTPPQVREASPIRVAMPVGRGVADAHEEQYSPPPAMPTQSLQQAVPEDRDLEDSPHDMGRAAAETTASHSLQGGGIKALVQYDYEKAEDNEVDLKEGDYVTDIEMVDQDWWLGVNTHGERGLFPSNYVELVQDSHQHEPAPMTQTHGLESDIPAPPADHFAPPTHGAAKEPTATALYDYEAAEDNELSFPEGGEITSIVSSLILQDFAAYAPKTYTIITNWILQEFPDDDWWLGEYGGKKGLFPANYVQLA